MATVISFPGVASDTVERAPRRNARLHIDLALDNAREALKDVLPVDDDVLELVLRDVRDRLVEAAAAGVEHGPGLSRHLLAGDSETMAHFRSHGLELEADCPGEARGRGCSCAFG